MRNRKERRSLAKRKIKQRETLMKNFGLKGGSLYRKHRRKIKKSTGYLTSGNVSHYINVHPARKVRDRERYGRSEDWSASDQRRIDSGNSSMEDYVNE